MKTFILAGCLFFICTGITAQQVGSPEKKWKFRWDIQLGILQGENKSAFHLQTVHGFAHDRFFAGLGVGLDFYRYRSVPLFAELVQYFADTKNGFFIYGDAGTHFIWENNTNPGIDKDKYAPGLYTAAGIGYRVANDLLLRAGYSYKRVINRQQYSSMCPFGDCDLTNKYTYSLSRLLLQVGWSF